MSIVSDLIIPLLLSINARFPYLKNNKKKKFFFHQCFSLSLSSLVIAGAICQLSFFFFCFYLLFSLYIFLSLYSVLFTLLFQCIFLIFSSFFSIYWFLVRPYSPYMADLVFNCSCCVFLLIGFLSLFL